MSPDKEIGADDRDRMTKIFYRSDWPELGFPSPAVPCDSYSPAFRFPEEESWVQEMTVSGIACRLAAIRSGFESDLYGISFWNLHLECEGEAGRVPQRIFGDPVFLDDLKAEMLHRLKSAPWKTAYVSSKLVKNEFFYDVLRQAGFEAVECRRLYRSNVSDLLFPETAFVQDRIKVISLADIPSGRIPACRRRILEICRETFEKEGCSRHFTDPVLKQRLPGADYIEAVMALYFKNISPGCFFVALDMGTDTVCGFTVVGKKPGLSDDIFTQLLSAVKKEYRGWGIYHTISGLLLRTLPGDGILLNVTDCNNRAIQKAYGKSGRSHLTDTVVMRRLF